MVKVAFGTVAYPKAAPFLPHFFNSLEGQSFSDFDLLIVAEGCLAYEKILRETRFGKRLVCREVPEENPIYLNRVELIRLAKAKSYDLLVLGDADDWFSSKRVENIVNIFSDEYACFYNELLYPDGNSVFPSLVSEASWEDILDKNFLGLSNTALNLHLISDTFIESLEDGATEIFDWYLFARVLKECGRGKLAKKASTYYRLHENNSIGAPKNEIEREYKVKREHYQLLAQRDEAFHRYREIFDKRHTLKNTTLSPASGLYWWDSLKIDDEKGEIYV